MKGLFLFLFFFLGLNVVSQYNQQFQDEYSRFGFHRFEKGHPYYDKQRTSHPIINFPVKNIKFIMDLKRQTNSLGLIA